MSASDGYLMIVHAHGDGVVELHDGHERGALRVWKHHQYGRRSTQDDFLVLRQAGRTVWLDRSTRAVHAGVRFVVVFKGEARAYDRGRNCVEGCVAYTGCQIAADFPIRKEA